MATTLEALTLAIATVERLDRNRSAEGTLDVLRDTIRTYLIYRLSETFSRIVRDRFAYDLKEIVRKNRLTEYEHSCATHDYCDANMLMKNAFVEVQGYDFDPSSTMDRCLWNDAWSRSAQREFVPTPL